MKVVITENTPVWCLVIASTLDSCCLTSGSDAPWRNTQWYPIGMAKSNRPVHSSWIPCRRGTDYIYQPFSPISSTPRQPFQTNDHAPWNTVNTSGWFCPSQGYWYIPLGEWQCHYSWRSMSMLLCQNCYLGVSFTLINDNIKICAKRGGKTLIDSDPNALLGNTELVEFIWMFWHSPPPEHWHMTSLQCHTPAFADWLCSPLGQKRLRGTRPPKSNIVKVVFRHERTQSSPVTACNIRPNTWGPLDGLHGCSILISLCTFTAISRHYHKAAAYILVSF